MTDEEFAAFHDERWAELDPVLKERARAIILAAFDPATLSAIRDDHAKNPIHWIGVNHHGWGTAVRNLLRTGDAGMDGIKDAELPSGNWDDYYIAAIEYAAGVRS